MDTPPVHTIAAQAIAEKGLPWVCRAAPFYIGFFWAAPINVPLDDIQQPANDSHGPGQDGT